MSLAADAREAVRERPFLWWALRAGVVNYTAAAERLDLDGDPDAVATALRRYADELPPVSADARRARVTMQSGVGIVTDDSDGDAEPSTLLTVGGVHIVDDAGSSTAILATGDVDTRALVTVLDRCAAANVGVEAAGVADESLSLVVSRRDGPTAVQLVEAALDAVMG